MGLDVYLEKCADLAKAEELEARYEKESEAIWHYDGREYDALTQEEKDAASERCDRLANELGLDADGQYPGRVKIEQDSLADPGHYFKIGYFRSSYNENGLNAVFRRAGIPDLYAIFEPPDGEYSFSPDWDAALARAKEAKGKLTTHMESTLGGYDCMAITCSFAKQELPANENEALAIFKEELERKRTSDMHSYSNARGEFFLNGLTCSAFIRGKGQFLVTPEEAVYVVYKTDKLKWYATALDIVIETIEYVLAQPDKADHYLCWSS